jgi:hypothetical protein
LPLLNLAQTDSTRNAIAFQVGGQTLVSFHHTYKFVDTKWVDILSYAGGGINENADDSDPSDRPIYGIHTGNLFLIGPSVLQAEMGIYSTTYFYKSISFVNINAWCGMRITPKNFGGFFGVGYTPRLYYTYSDPNNHFFNSKFAFKMGFEF